MKITTNNLIHCFECNKNLSLAEVFLHQLFEGSISCERDHLVGRDCDIEWCYLTASCSYFYLYHAKGQCRCLQEATNCLGIAENCCYPLGLRCYEEELEDKI